MVEGEDPVDDRPDPVGAHRVDERDELGPAADRHRSERRARGEDRVRVEVGPGRPPTNPTTAISPPSAAAASDDSSVPATSTTRSAPRPPVAARTAAGQSGMSR